MKATSTSHTILSLTSPGVQVVPLDQQPSLARSINEYAAALCAENPTKFSFFAAVPSLFSTSACIAEIAHALDVLGASGVTLFTRYGDGSAYLGHPAFRPVWAELNARQAVVFVHPTHGPGSQGLINPLLPLPFIDYPHETARTAMDMLSTGTKRDFPDCKVILSHAGGTLPILVFRAAPGVEMISRARVAAGAPGSREVKAVDLVADAMTFYYDLALSSSKNVLDTLVRNFPTDRILYGSDFPYAPRPAIESLARHLDGYELDDGVREDIYSRNALKLFPRLASLQQ